MTFLRGIYFMIVTMSTIGYGDYCPAHRYVRVWLMLTLIGYVGILSNDLTKLADDLKNVSDYETSFNFVNHIVIVGSYNASYLLDFLMNFY